MLKACKKNLQSVKFKSNFYIYWTNLFRIITYSSAIKYQLPQVPVQPSGHQRFFVSATSSRCLSIHSGIIDHWTKFFSSFILSDAGKLQRLLQWNDQYLLFRHLWRRRHCLLQPLLWHRLFLHLLCRACLCPYFQRWNSPGHGKGRLHWRPSS